MVTYTPDMEEEVFRALADPTRRMLLDRLFAQDGRTLGELCADLSMTRYGVMKHLKILERASLVVTRRSGREKLHYLNPVPIRLLHDRWIGKYSRPWVSALSALKHQLEDSMSERPRHFYEVYIRTTPEKLWDAITRPEQTEKYFYGTRFETELKPGAPFSLMLPDGKPAIAGKILEVKKLEKLVMTWETKHDPEAALDRPSRVTWEIEPRGETCRVTLTHDEFESETKTFHSVSRGWNLILSGLKTLLETGKPLEVAAPVAKS